MDTKGTIRTALRTLAGLVFFTQIVLGQTAALPSADTAWRKLGNDSVGLNLAGPAGGPIDAVWFSAAGDRVFVRTRAGEVFETADFSAWSASKTASTPQSDLPITDVRSPEPGAKIQAVGSRLYSLGVNLEVSEDYGLSWTNLTAYNHDSVIGGHQHAVAVSPLDPQQIVVANDYGVWRSADGGLSWSGLNDDLPNLPMRRLLPSASTGSLRAEVAGIGLVELPPAAAAAHANWIRSTAADSSADGSAQRRAASKTVGVEIVALAQTSSDWFAGSADGRLWASPDNGATWNPPWRSLGVRVEAIVTADQTPHSALAVAGSGLYRTTDDGHNWENIASGLPEGPLHGAAVDAVAGVAYVAGDRGVFTAHVDMNNPVPVAAWQRLSGLPAAPAMDVRLDPVRNLLYVAVDGYGVYAASAPHKSATVQVLTAGDQPAEVAAPGVLLRVEGSGLSNVKSESGDLTLVASSASSAQVQVPFEAAGSTLALTVDSSQGQSRFALPLKLASPSILVDADGFPIVVDAATGLTLDARNMAHPGSRIQVFAAGLGKVNPEWRAGVPAPEDPPVVEAQVNAVLNGAAVEVTRATLAPGYVGLYLVEVQLPGLVNAGAADFSLLVNGQPSNHVKILLSLD